MLQRMDVPIAIDTLVAYLRTTYRVHASGGEIMLRIGAPNAALRALQRTHGVACSSFVTACNPFGRRASAHDNRAAMHNLRAYLDDADYAHIDATGQGIRGWPAEPSVLVLGADDAQARALCLRFEQNAVVGCAAAARPYLLLHPQARLRARQAPICPGRADSGVPC